jgi:hypothetical protein
MTLYVFLIVFAAQFILSRAIALLLKRMGDTAVRIYLAHAVSFVIATLGIAWLTRMGGPPRILEMAVLNLLPLLVWVTVDILRLLRRRAKLRDAIAIAKMR